MSNNEYNLHKYYILEDGKTPHFWLRTSGLLVTSYTLAENMTTQYARDIARIAEGKKPYSLYNEFHELVAIQKQESTDEPSESCEASRAEPIYFAFYINKTNPELAIDYLDGESGNKFVSLLEYVDVSTLNPVKSDELGAFNLDNFYVIRSEKEHITLKDVLRAVQNSK